MRYILLTFTSLCLLISSVNAANDVTLKQVKIETSEGDIVLELDITRAPLSVLNFMKYARSGFYDGTIGWDGRSFCSLDNALVHGNFAAGIPR